MLRAQVAVSIDKMPFAHSRGKNARSLREKAAQGLMNAPDKSRWLSQARIEQNAAVVRQALAPMNQMLLSGHESRNSPAVEVDEGISKLVELPPSNLPRRDRMVEHRSFIEAAHNHKPVDDQALVAADRKAVS